MIETIELLFKGVLLMTGIVLLTSLSIFVTCLIVEEIICFIRRHF